MKVIGALLVCFSLGMRTAQNIGDNQFDYAFAIIIIGILLILFDKSEKYKGIPKMENPPAPPKKCICNDIGKHTPGGRCEANHFELLKNELIEKRKRPEFPKDRT